MVFQRFVQIGRVVYINSGPDAGKVAAIIDIIDQNRALLDGPCSGVARQARRFTELHLTRLTIKINKGAAQKSVRAAWEESKINDKWAGTSWAKRIERRLKRESLTDLERFKLASAKHSRNAIVRQAFNSLRVAGLKSTVRNKKRVAALKAKAKASAKK